MGFWGDSWHHSVSLCKVSACYELFPTNKYIWASTLGILGLAGTENTTVSAYFFLMLVLVHWGTDDQF